MHTISLDKAPLIRLGFFIGVFIIMALWEALSQRRHQPLGRSKRWPHNLLLILVDSLCLKLLLPLTAVSFALSINQHQLGLFPQIPLPYGITFILSLLILDIGIYFQHRLFHVIPWLWRIHRMHHTDLEFDVTTGIRFHPIEIILSMLIKFIIIALFGIPAQAVLCFEIVLNATSLFNHGNVNMRAKLDTLIRRLIVTPDMHRVHHSSIPIETNSNYGFNLSIWDKLFKTYCAEPKKGHTNMTIGLNEFRNPQELTLDKLLTQPFRNDDTSRT